MISVNLTTFVDIVSKAGTPKVTAVRQLKQREEYNPAHDFYKPLREQIIEAHKTGAGRTHLSDLMPSLSDRKKLTAYPVLIDQYKKWWGRKDIRWFKPPTGSWTSGGVRVHINPELGLIIGDERVAVKLYFKGRPQLSKRRIDVILHLLDKVTARHTPKATGGVLEIRRAKLYTPTVDRSDDLEAALHAEAAYIVAAWDHV